MLTCRYAGIAQLVERNLAKVEVASSSLVSRSNMMKQGRFGVPVFFRAWRMFERVACVSQCRFLPWLLGFIMQI